MLARECARRQRAWGIRNPGFLAWGSTLAAALRRHRPHRRRRSTPATSRPTSRARFGVAREHGMALLALGGITGDAETLRAAVDVLRRLPGAARATPARSPRAGRPRAAARGAGARRALRRDRAGRAAPATRSSRPARRPRRAAAHRRRRADRRPGARRAARRRRARQPRDRRAAVRDREDGRGPPRRRLPQARDRLAQPARRGARMKGSDPSTFVLALQLASQCLGVSPLRSTSRASRSSHVSRRTTTRAAPSRAKTTGMRRVPL